MGVKVAVWLEIVAGLMTIVSGFLPIALILVQPSLYGITVLFFLPFGITVLILAFVIASLFFILAQRLWKGGSLARKIALMLSILGVAFSLFLGFAGGYYANPLLRTSANPFDYMAFILTLSALILNIPLLYFLTRKDVKEFSEK